MQLNEEKVKLQNLRGLFVSKKRQEMQAAIDILENKISKFK